jgi:hypothetical protein
MQANTEGKFPSNNPAVAFGSIIIWKPGCQAVIKGGQKEFAQHG